jgi:hypothetical protein
MQEICKEKEGEEKISVKKLEFENPQGDSDEILCSSRRGSFQKLQKQTTDLFFQLTAKNFVP